MVSTKFFTDPARAGLVEISSILTRDAAGLAAGILTKTGHVYLTNCTPSAYLIPYMAHRVRTVTTVYDGSTAAVPASTKRERVYFYDNLSAPQDAADCTSDVAWKAGFGNLTFACDQKNWWDPVDDICSSEEFFPRTQAEYDGSYLYITNKPAHGQTWLWPSIAGPTQVLLNERYLYYSTSTKGDWPPGNGLLTRREDWLEHQGANSLIETTWAYDVKGNVIKEVGPAPRNVTTEYIYDPTYQMYVAETRDPIYPTDTRHKTEVMEWDAQCWAPKKSVDMNGVTTEQQYDALCQPTVTNLMFGTTTVKLKEAKYVGFANAVTAANPAARWVETWTPGPPGQGELWVRTFFDGLGRTYKTQSIGPSAGKEIIRDVTYDARGNTAKTRGPYYVDATPPNWSEIHYDALNRPTRQIHPDRHFTATAYELFPILIDTRTRYLQSVRATDEEGHQQRDVFDSWGLVAHQELEGLNWHSTTYAYTARGQLRTITDPKGNVVAYEYDSFGRKRKTVDPDMGTWTYDYTSEGWLKEQVDALSQRTLLEYDNLGRLKRKSLRSGLANEETVTWTYDGATIPYGLGKLASAVNSSVSHTHNSYDALGNLLSLTTRDLVNGTDYLQKWGYDASGRYLTGQKFPDGDYLGDDPSTTATVEDPLAYNAAGKLTRIPSNGTVLIGNVEYEAFGAVRTVARGEGSFVVVTERTYDPNRRWLTSLRSTQTTTASGICPSYSATRTTNATYRGIVVPAFSCAITLEAGDVLKVGTCGVTGSSGSGDTFLRLKNPGGTEVARNDNACTGLLSYLTYVAPGAGTYELVEGCAGMTSCTGTVAYRIETTRTLQDFDYSKRDAEGKILLLAGASCRATWQYSYDDPHRVRSAQSTSASDRECNEVISFKYDEIGNITYNSKLGPPDPNGENYYYTSGRPHAVTALGTPRRSYAYDANGNMASRDSRTLTYDGENRLVQVGTGMTIVYDASGERIKKTINGSTTLYLGNDYETDLSTGTHTKYFSLAGVQVAKKVGTTPYWLLTDHLGSVHVVLDSRGEVLRREYMPYGDVRANTGTHAESKAFIGEREDQTGLIYLHARYYDPELARFISPDPTIPNDRIVGLNSFAYADNDPVNRIDQSGYASIDDEPPLELVPIPTGRGLELEQVNIPESVITEVPGGGFDFHCGGICDPLTAPAPPESRALITAENAEQRYEIERAVAWLWYRYPELFPERRIEIRGGVPPEEATGGTYVRTGDIVVDPRLSSSTQVGNIAHELLHARPDRLERLRSSIRGKLGLLGPEGEPGLIEDMAQAIARHHALEVKARGPVDPGILQETVYGQPFFLPGGHYGLMWSGWGAEYQMRQPGWQR
jgi:RHS repeat-associated protein